MDRNDIFDKAVFAALIGYTLVILVPPLWMLMASFKPSVAVTQMPPDLTGGFTIENYESVFVNGNFPQFLLNSIIIVTLTLVATLTLGTAAGYALSRSESRFKSDAHFFALTTRMGPPVAFGLPMYILFSRMNLLDTYTGMVVIYLLFNLAFAIWMMKGFFDEVPVKLEEAAQMDGYSRFSAFYRVALPLVKPGLVATAIFVFIFTWNEFFYALFLTNTNAKTYTVQLLAFQGSYDVQWGELFAAASVASVPPIVFAVIARKRLARGLTFGTIK